MTSVKRPKPQQTNLGWLLRTWRWQERLSIRDAARRLELSAATVSRIERGHAPDPMTLICVMAWFLRAVRKEVRKERRGGDIERDSRVRSAAQCHWR